MALRSLDNTLPITPERPKKIAKLSVPIPKSSDSSVNDENKVPAPVSGEPVIEYVSSENLVPISHPEAQIQNLMEGLESKDWIKVCESLNYARRFALYHSSLLLPILDKFMIILVKSMKNPRSALCKTSIMAASDVFKTFGHDLIESSTSDAFDQLLLQLLLKASQDKRFVCEEADKTLNVMVGSMPPLTLLRKLSTYVNHGSLKVRAKASVFIAQCVSKMGLEGMKEFGLTSLILIAAGLLNDRLPEAREAARSTVISVYKAYAEDEEHQNSELSVMESWHNLCCSHLPAIQAHSLIKIVSSLV